LAWGPARAIDDVLEPGCAIQVPTETGSVVFMTVPVGPKASLAHAHQLASELEEELRQRLPEIADVVVHTEP
jgi:divalent metal cation (Fe/Co/Zn/Cd) transporter